MSEPVKTIPFQPVSLDIWDMKYRLRSNNNEPIDADMDATYERVAKALSDVEKTPALRKKWFVKFLEALKKGATPAGRITSNAGAGEHKPATSTINCTVSSTIEDSMQGILEAVKEAGLTLKAGCGIGYEFSTLRPKGSFVAGAGSTTSGPLSFMDIFDKTCFTVASAGGRRGAQMGTFDVSHPDIIDFIKAKRENGRLRQFNLSALITKDFMEAVVHDSDWKLIFPITKKELEISGLDVNNPDQIVWKTTHAVKDTYHTVKSGPNAGKVACKVYKVIKARRLWDMIMASTYDFAEPGFILIDKVNEMNNNWWCENIRATNPCVTGETVILTKQGYKRIDSLVGQTIEIWNGYQWSFVTPTITGTNQEIYDMEFSDGTTLPPTPYHKFILSDGSRIEAKDLTPEHKLSNFTFPIVPELLEVNLSKIQDITNEVGIYEQNKLCFYSDLYAYLNDIKLTLNTIGATGKIIKLENSFKLEINNNNLSKLINIGFKLPFDIFVETEEQEPITLVSKQKRDTLEPQVYCFNEPINHSGVFNGLMTANCGEQPLPPYGSCLLGSINLTKFVRNPFTDEAYFDWEDYKDVVATFTRMLDNVVEINGLPLPQQRHEIIYKRRHGMGFLGLGSALTMMKIKYGDQKSIAFTEEASKVMAITGFEVGIELAKEKGCAEIFKDKFEVTPEMMNLRPEMANNGVVVGDMLTGRELMAKYSRYMQNMPEHIRDGIMKHGCRFTHHTSIAPTGTISLSLANNASNGIEPSFAHHYSRNVIVAGKKSKEKVDVFSYELLAYRTLVNPKAMPFSTDPEEQLPDYFLDSSTIMAKAHVDIQAASQIWIDSSISKTINVPTDYDFEDFKNIYTYAYEKGLKGCTTFRFNPEAFQGVLVTEKDLANTTYAFTLEDGTEVSFKGNEEIEYDGEIHTAANLFDAIKENYYGKF